MRDDDCVRFLQWALPRLHMRWAGFRRVHKRVCKHLNRRLAELGLTDLDAYRALLDRQREEWQTLDRLCRVVISRFYRDRLVFEALMEQVLPELAGNAIRTGGQTLRCWSIGSASGEEPYTLAILWREALAARFPQLELAVLATEIDAQLLQRSRQACYPAGSVRNLPAPLRAAAFEESGEDYCLRPGYRAMVEFRQQDVRDAMPDGPFQLVLCRNLVFTYYDEQRQRRILAELLARLAPGGWLVLGVREQLPAGATGLTAVSPRLGLYRKGASPE